MELLFWGCFGVVCWCYLGYPVTILVRARLFPKALHPRGEEWPRVCVVLAVRNGAAHIGSRLDNLLSQEYPGDGMEILVVCNGCDDDTYEIARRIGQTDRRVRVLTSPAEQGKAGAINLGMASSTSELVVFADVRQCFAPDAVLRLVEPLRDPSVGAVTGRLVIERAATPAVEGVRWYWGLETSLRVAEGRTGSVVGATGAIYAIRRSAFEPLPPNLILDDVAVPLRIAISGLRVVMAPEAVAFDVPSDGQRLEFVRKRRTMVGNLQLVRLIPSLLVPLRNPMFLRFVSHKVLRVLSPLCFVGMLAAAAALPGWAYRGFFSAELAVYVLGIAGIILRARLLAVPSAFVLMHAAIFAALLRFREDATSVWAPARRHPIPAPE